MKVLNTIMYGYFISFIILGLPICYIRFLISAIKNNSIVLVVLLSMVIPIQLVVSSFISFLYFEEDGEIITNNYKKKE